MKEDMKRYQGLIKNNENPVDLEELKPHKIGLPIKYLWFCLFDTMKNEYIFPLELLRDVEKFLFVSILYPPSREKIIEICAVLIYYNRTEKPISPSFKLRNEEIEKEFQNLQKTKNFKNFYAKLNTLVNSCVQSKNKEIIRLVNGATERKIKIILNTGLFTLLSIGLMWYYKYRKK